MPWKSLGGCAMQAVQAPDPEEQLSSFHFNSLLGETRLRPSRKIRPLLEVLAPGKFSASRCWGGCAKFTATISFLFPDDGRGVESAGYFSGHFARSCISCREQRATRGSLLVFSRSALALP